MKIIIKVKFKDMLNTVNSEFFNYINIYFYIYKYLQFKRNKK